MVSVGCCTGRRHSPDLTRRPCTTMARACRRTTPKQRSGTRGAAAQGHALAQHNIGAMYSIGEGVPVDHVEAVKWYRMAAEQGLARPQYNLGVMYSEGWVVPQGTMPKRRSGIGWLPSRADAKAQYNLGVMYDNGFGVPQDYAEALKWYRLAAGKGQTAPPSTISASMYGMGHGVSQDDVQALKWLNLAVTNGDKNATEMRDAIAARMTPAQIAKGAEARPRVDGGVREAEEEVRVETPVTDAPRSKPSPRLPTDRDSPVTADDRAWYRSSNRSPSSR